MRLSTIAFRNLARNKKRSALSISTIVIACVLGFFMLAMIAGMKTDMEKNILSYFTGAVRIRHTDYDTYDYLSPIHLYVPEAETLREELLSIKGVTAVTGRISPGGMLYVDPDPKDTEPGEEYGGMALGLNFETEEGILDPESLLLEGRLPKDGTREAALGAGLAEEAGLAIGDSFAFMTQTVERSANAMTFEVTGFLNFPMGSMNETHLIIPFDTAEDLTHMYEGAQELIIMTEDPGKAEIQQEEIDALLAAHPEYGKLSTALWKNQGDFYAMIEIAGIMYQMIVLFFLLMGATVIINTTMMVVLERYREIGILRAMGMEASEMVKLFFLEALFAGIISAVIGTLIGGVVIQITQQTGLDFGAAYSQMDMEVSNILYPEFRWLHLLLMFIYTVGISAVVTLLPCRRAATIEPAEAIRS